MTHFSDKSAAVSVAAVVLAGGRGSRMGGVDKGLQAFKGQPLVQHALQRLQEQTADGPSLIGINANRNTASYQTLGFPVWQDARPDYSGPLAGFLAAMQACKSEFPDITHVLTVPCDSPIFPLDLLERLLLGLKSDGDGDDEGADIAMASAAERNPDGSITLRRQPVFCLMKIGLLDGLQSFLEAGGSKINAWAQQGHCVEVAFDRQTDHPDAFFNANTLAQLHQLETL
jgi:molybdopterin-guanine dinucleotide biosynthesis protein A